MKQAEQNVRASGGFGAGDYNFIGNNCQTYVDRVLQEYQELQGGR